MNKYYVEIYIGSSQLSFSIESIDEESAEESVKMLYPAIEEYQLYIRIEEEL